VARNAKLERPFLLSALYSAAPQVRASFGRSGSFFFQEFLCPTPPVLPSGLDEGLAQLCQALIDFLLPPGDSLYGGGEIGPVRYTVGGQIFPLVILCLD
jgi:hypothetical protein